jgi:hypothetical protein
MGTSFPNNTGDSKGFWRSRLNAGYNSPWTTTVLLIVCLMLLSLQFWHLSLFGSRLDSQVAGTWGDMTSSVASAFAVIIAVGTVAVEQRRSARERTEARVRELTQVYCWIEWGLASDHTHTWVLKFQNETKVPIFKWLVHISPVPGAGKVVLSSSAYGPIRPSSTEMLVDELSGTAPELQPSLDFDFKDPSGSCWRRSADATLTPLLTLEAS